MIVVIDNRDSFVFNLARHFQLLGVETAVVSSHEAQAEAILAARPAAIVISPGPCTPIEAGCSLDLVRVAMGRIPLLGVCLGHQVLAAAGGGRIVRATRPTHGRTSQVHHDGVNLFAGIPSPMTACRYHSLVAEAASLPEGLIAVARDEEGTVMAIADDHRCAYGVQFHPESILTRHGFRLLANFLTAAGIPHRGALVDLLDDEIARQAVAPVPHDDPTAGPVVTF
ncbi:MAG: aminodeoxychorismate/anthranilate synthase component II [Planctomycetes bacterium]|nr:aminodeoxychorismate/anthranilate synthase component II [Planctomycetota bacterium]